MSLFLAGQTLHKQHRHATLSDLRTRGVELDHGSTPTVCPRTGNGGTYVPNCMRKMNIEQMRENTARV